MRRKNWINKKKFFYDNYVEFNKLNIKNKNINYYFYNLFLKKHTIVDKYNNNDQLKKIFLKKLKSSNLNINLNYYFYSDFLNLLKYKNRKILFKNFVQNNKTLFLFSPIYMFKSQFFDNKSLFNDLLKNFKLKGFFIYKNFFNSDLYKSNDKLYKKHLIGYNFYIFNKNYKNYDNVLKFTDNKDFNSIGRIKLLKSQDDFYNPSFKNELSFFLFFNIYLLSILEIYKIMMFLYLNNIQIQKN